jgi:hypothetical protein
MASHLELRYIQIQLLPISHGTRGGATGGKATNAAWRWHGQDRQLVLGGHAPGTKS